MIDMTLTNVALVLSGGNALGAYHAGAVEALMDEGLDPGWIVGTSIGAITAALIAGNARENRPAVLRAFWRRSAWDMTAWVPEPLRSGTQLLSAWQSRLAGEAGLFETRWPDLFGRLDTGLYDVGPLRAFLRTHVDVRLLNEGPIRLTVTAVDLETAALRVFDTAHHRIGVDEILASAALVPDFAPVVVDGRRYVDGGFAANLPVDLALDASGPDRLLCFACDLLPATPSGMPGGLLGLMQRQSDLTYAAQTRRTLAAQDEIWRLRADGRGAMVHWLQYRADRSETALKGFDFSRASVERRWAAGAADMRTAVQRWRAHPAIEPGLTIASNAES